MKNISFMLTTEQIRNRTKTVTRRMGWKNLRPGELLQACVKCQGIKKGEHPEKLCVIRVRKVRNEKLNELEKEPFGYGRAEVVKEGFPKIQPAEFVDFFCDHNGCQPTDEITRVEFEYV